MPPSGNACWTLPCPAKINLFLAVTGRRADGYHDLVSLAAPLAWGDSLHVTVDPSGGEDRLGGTDPALDYGPDNLVTRAARAFRERREVPGAVHFHLEKRIPLGAGLGGGSSDAATTLRALNQLAPDPLGADELRELAAGLGSDVPLFLEGGPVFLRGRGERLSPLPPCARDRLADRSVLVAVPGFSVPTAWAYARLAERPAGYTPETQAEEWAGQWARDGDGPLVNSFAEPLEEKFAAYPALREQLAAAGDLRAQISGSGSGFFLFDPPADRLPRLREIIAEAWGGDTLLVETRLAFRLPDPSRPGQCP